MTRIVAERVSAKLEEEVVVFLIGMRINRFWKLHKWLPPFIAMSRMQSRLKKLPTKETGCLSVTIATPGLTVMYWRSFKDLEAFAHGEFHRPAWTKFNQSNGQSRADVGIWHETYIIAANNHESVYSGMPPHGLGKAVGVVPSVGEMSAARKRLNLPKT